MPTDLSYNSLEAVRSGLRDLLKIPARPTPSDHKTAAVLILIYPGRKGLETILTRRSGQLPNHAGQISFPGGRLEPDDANLVQTALREAHEEIGLDIRQVEVIGCLQSVHLPSKFHVTPVVGLMEQKPSLTPEPGEVEEIFSIPLAVVLDIGLYQQGSNITNGIKKEFYYFDYNEYYIWGATAYMLRSLACFLSGARGLADL